MFSLMFGIIVIVVNVIMGMMSGEVSIISIVAIGCGSALVGYGLKELENRNV